MPKISSKSNGQDSPGVIITLERGRDFHRIPTGPDSSSPVHDEDDLAHDPNLVETIQHDIAALGLVGEEDPGMLTFLMYSGRKLLNSNGIILRGRSGSGKDQIQRIPAQLMPPEDVLEATSITANSFLFLFGSSLSASARSLVSIRIVYFRSEVLEKYSGKTRPLPGTVRVF